MEGFSSHMWEWYTGTIIWKTQNPWTALRGQMYDYYLDGECMFIWFAQWQRTITCNV